MTESIKVRAEHEYQVIFAPATNVNLQPAIKDASKIAIIVPEDLVDLATSLEKRLATSMDRSIEKVLIIKVPEGENQKNLASVERCWNILGENQFRRSDAIIGLGGGATTDLAGFVAATWLRGVPWAAIPTSLAGMVDAAIGGKTGINTSAGKNLVGSFYSPKVVIVDYEYLTSLPELELRSGLAEIIKCGFIADRRILEIIETSDDFADPKSRSLQELIRRAIQVKAEVVSEDLRESYLREILNYGHTLAHAIERRENYTVRHGDAVAIGMAFISALTVQVGKCSEVLRDRHLAILKRAKLPIKYVQGAWPELLSAMRSDKKATNKGIRFVAVTDDFEVIRLEGVTEAQMLAAYERISL